MKITPCKMCMSAFRVLLLVSLPVWINCHTAGYLMQAYNFATLTVGIQENATKAQEDIIGRQKDRLKDLNSAISRIENKLEKQEYNAAFSYGYDEQDTFKEGEILRFREKLIRVGNGYDPKTGIFTCPKSGLYVFTLMAASSDTVFIEIRVNGDPMATLYIKDEGKDADQSTGTIVTFLKEGEQVWPQVKVCSQGSTLAPNAQHTTFTGFLVKLT